MTSLEFHPNYASNGKLYVISGEAIPNASTPHYMPPQTDEASAFDNVLFEYQVSSTDPNLVDLSTKRELLRIRQAHRFHNMNDMAFATTAISTSVSERAATRARARRCNTRPTPRIRMWCTAASYASTSTPLAPMDAMRFRPATHSPPVSFRRSTAGVCETLGASPATRSRATCTLARTVTSPWSRSCAWSRARTTAGR